MPLARILTAFPERAESLAQQLREKGYTVEFLGPEKAGMLRADLEIDFEICDQKVVLRRAAELANKLHADIAVSPEALPAGFTASESEFYVGENEIVEVPTHIADPFVETFLAQGERTGQIQNLEQSEHVVSLPPDMLASEKAGANIPEPPSPMVPDPERHAAGSFGFETHAFENHVSENLEAENAFEHHSLEDHPFEDHRFEDHRFEDHAFAADGYAGQSQPLNQASEHAEEVVPSPVVRSTVVGSKKDEWMERIGSLSSSALAATRKNSASLAASARRVSADCREWINVRLSAVQDARQQRQIEAEKQRELVRARAEELEIARDAAAARLQDLLRERGGLTDRQPVPPTAAPELAYRNTPGPVPAYRNSNTEPPVAPLPNAASLPNQGAGAGWSEKTSAWFQQAKDAVLTRRYGQQWEAVLMGVAAACALFVVGVAVNSFRPHPALSNTITKPSAQPSSGQTSRMASPVSARATSPGVTTQGANPPYSGVTIQGGKPGVTLLPAPAKAGAAQPGQAQTAASRPSPAESDVTVRHFSNKPSPRNGGIASDVTVRHFNQQPKPAARNTSDGVKRFSDLD